MAHAHKLLLIALISGGFLSSTSAQNTDTSDAAFYEFLHALGEPALIGANAGHELADSAYRPIPALSVEELNPDKMRLGFDLFHENRFAIDQSVGCNNCHSGMFSGTDGRTVSTGARGQLGKLNSPTTFNAAFNFRQFWDGRAVTLADQALGPIENELEMAHKLPAVVDMLRQDDNYPAEFAAVYPDGITVNNMADAIAYFQRVNFTRSTTPFVRHLAGEDGQLSEQALRGWQRFDEVGCVSCHNGINLGGNSYQQLGSAMDYFIEHRTAGPNDDGVFGRSGRDGDKHVFKVPTLHGVAETAPYFHDGSVDSLEVAIAEMGEHQLGLMLSDQDINDIAAFLNSLGGRPMGMAMGNMGMGRGMGMRGGMNGGMNGGMRGGMNSGMGRGMQSGMSAPADTSAATLAAPSDPAAHDEMYQAALAAVAQSRDKILFEMERIHNAEVAHYDFLQFEHLELIRHARALAFPPGTLDLQTQQNLQARANQLLAGSHELEWLIADFLRAEAMTRVIDSTRSQDSDIRIDQPGDPLQQRRLLQEQAVVMMDAVRDSGINDKALAVATAYQTVQ